MEAVDLTGPVTLRFLARTFVTWVVRASGGELRQVFQDYVLRMNHGTQEIVEFYDMDGEPTDPSEKAENLPMLDKHTAVIRCVWPDDTAVMDLQKLLDAEAFHRFAVGGMLNRDGFLQAACASDPSAEDLAKRVWSNMKDDGMSMSEEEWDAHFRPHLQCSRVGGGRIRQAASETAPVLKLVPLQTVVPCCGSHKPAPGEPASFWRQEPCLQAHPNSRPQAT